MIIFVGSYLGNNRSSIYTGNEKKICGHIVSIYSNNDKATLEIKNKEKIVGYYNFENLVKQNEFNSKYHYGDEICVVGDLIKPSDNRIFNLFNYRKYLLSKNIYFSMNINKIEKKKNNSNFIYCIKNMIIKRINSLKYSQSYLYAFILGDNRYLGDEVMDAYRTIGVSHLFAVSGMHISFLTGFIMLVLNCFFVNNRIKMIITCLILLFITNIFLLSPSIIRATLLFLCLTIDKICGLKQKPIKYLMMIFIINLIINCNSIYNVGFVFSYTISFFLLFYQSKFKEIKSKLRLSFMISIVSFLVSIPILINNFLKLIC